MIKIKDYIFNENEIIYIVNIDENNKLRIRISNEIWFDIPNAKFEDIEWNYGTPQETQRQMQKELCKSCYYRDTISNQIKELEEKNKTFEDYNKDLNNQLYKLEDDLDAEKSASSNLARRILKAIAYIEENTTDPEFVVSGELQENQVIELLKILKGEE